MYSTAKTDAELFPIPKTLHPDFVNFLTMPQFPVKNAQNDLMRQVFGTRFHVVYGQFQPPAFGPGNNILFAFNQSYNQLFMSSFGQPFQNVALGEIQSVSDDSMTWRSTEHQTVVTRRSEQVGSSNVWHIHVTQNGNTVYSYYVVPVVFG